MKTYPELKTLGTVQKLRAELNAVKAKLRKILRPSLRQETPVSFAGESATVGNVWVGNTHMELKPEKVTILKGQVLWIDWEKKTWGAKYP